MFTVCGGLLLAVTPLGRNGVERFAGLFDRGDENYSFREDALSQALEKNSAGEVIFGNGVGLQPTDLGDKYIYDLSEATLNVRRIEAHNSFAAIYHRAGLIGLALVAVPILVLVRRMMRRRQDMTVSMFLAFVAFMTVMAFFNVVLENSFFGIWFWLPLFVGALLAASPHVAET